MTESPKEQKRVTCWYCRRYLRDERRCQDGKTNPKRKTDTVKIAELLGARALCHYNPYREDIIWRTYFPNHPHTRIASASFRKKRTRNREIIEIVSATENVNTAES